MKKILITGVSRGLGKILADFLSQNECLIYGTVRDLQSFKDKNNIKYIYLDLQNKESIDQAITQIFQIAGTLDGIIHNAGIAYLDPADVMTDDERRHLFDVNFFGPLYLTEKALPYLRAAKKGKLIFMSSIASIDHWPSLGVYSASKASLECVAFEWAVLLKKWNIDVSVIRANPLPTGMQILKSTNTASSPYESSFCNELLWEKTEDVCDLILKILNSKSPNFAYATGDLSKQTIDSLVKEDAYQELLEKYRKKLNTC